MERRSLKAFRRSEGGGPGKSRECKGSHTRPQGAVGREAPVAAHAGLLGATHFR
jgi:hypothetical protein